MTVFSCEEKTNQPPYPVPPDRNVLNGQHISVVKSLTIVSEILSQQVRLSITNRRPAVIAQTRFNLLFPLFRKADHA